MGRFIVLYFETPPIQSLLIGLMTFFIFSGSCPVAWGGEDIKYDWKKVQGSNDSPSAREYLRMASTEDGRVILFGGETTGMNKKPDTYQDDTWEYSVKSQQWVEHKLFVKPQRRRLHGMAQGGEGTIVIFGGENGDAGGENLDDTWEYDVVKSSWKEVPHSAEYPRARTGHAMAYLGNGKILLFGGSHRDRTGATVALADTWIYDRQSKKWKEMKPASSPSARYYHAMTQLAENKVLLFGGNVDAAGTWIYDYSKNIWKRVRTVSPSGRRYHALVSGPKMALLLGGFSGWPNLDDFWVFNDELMRWKKIEVALPVPRHGHFMTGVPGGKIVMFGGFSDDKKTLGDTWELSIGTKKSIE